MDRLLAHVGSPSPRELYKVINPQPGLCRSLKALSWVGATSTVWSSQQPPPLATPPAPPWPRLGPAPGPDSGPRPQSVLCSRQACFAPGPGPRTQPACFAAPPPRARVSAPQPAAEEVSVRVGVGWCADPGAGPPAQVSSRWNVRVPGVAYRARMETLRERLCEGTAAPPRTAALGIRRAASEADLEPWRP